MKAKAVFLICWTSASMWWMLYYVFR